MIKFTLPASRRVFLFLCITVFCLLTGSAIISLITGRGLTTPTVRIATIIQDVMVFILPAIATALMITRQPADFLAVRRRPKLTTMLLVTTTILASIPAMNAIIAWNASLHLPESMAVVENYIRAAEESASSSIQLMIGSPTVVSLIMMFLIVAVLAGFSEEIFFRGTIQRLMSTAGVRTHVAVWVTALIFSAVHFQFFGFVPRFLLGAYLGYLVVWSGSLWPSVWAHILNNALAVCSLWQEARGGKFLGSMPGFSDTDVNLTAAAISAVAVAVLVALTAKQR